MMLAQGEYINILDNNQFIMVLMEDRAVDKVPHVLLVSLGKVEHSFRIPVRCFSETLPIGVFTKTFKDCPHSPRELLNPRLIFLWG